MNNITGTNLNLFVAFDAMAAECSVSRAARRVGVTQSAMSGTLRQLRALFGDPLFTRTSHGLVPTRRASELAPVVRDALRLLQGTLTPERFDPATSGRVFTIAASDYVEFVVLPPLLARLARDAPRVRVEVRPWGLQQVPEDLGAGRLDLMIGFYDAIGRHHREEMLFEERYACIVRRGHPTVGKKLTLAAYAKLGHVMVTQQRGASSGIDRALAEKGLVRDVAVRVSHFLNVPSVVARTDHVAALARRVAVPFAKAFGLRIFAPPLALRVSRIGMVWHDTVDADAGHAWFRRLVRSICTKV